MQGNREQDEEELLKSEDGNKRLLSFFERVRFEFPGNEDLYPAVDWVKAKSASGSNYDCLEITRAISKD